MISKNNIDIRMSFVTCNYNVGLTIYDVSKPKVLNYKKTIGIISWKQEDSIKEV